MSYIVLQRRKSGQVEVEAQFMVKFEADEWAETEARHTGRDTWVFPLSVYDPKTGASYFPGLVCDYERCHRAARWRLNTAKLCCDQHIGFLADDTEGGELLPLG